MKMAGSVYLLSMCAAPCMHTAIRTACVECGKLMVVDPKEKGSTAEKERYAETDSEFSFFHFFRQLFFFKEWTLLYCARCHACVYRARRCSREREQEQEVEAEDTNLTSYIILKCFLKSG